MTRIQVWDICRYERRGCSNGSNEMGRGDGGRLWMVRKADGFMTYKLVTRGKGDIYIVFKHHGILYLHLLFTTLVNVPH